jgi:hypothetical protein
VEIPEVLMLAPPVTLMEVELLLLTAMLQPTVMDAPLFAVSAPAPVGSRM